MCTKANPTPRINRKLLEVTEGSLGYINLDHVLAFRYVTTEGEYVKFEYLMANQWVRQKSRVLEFGRKVMNHWRDYGVVVMAIDIEKIAGKCTDDLFDGVPSNPDQYTSIKKCLGSTLQKELNGKTT